MSHALKPVESLSEAWLAALDYTIGSGNGRTPHLMMTVTQPGRETSCIRRGIDNELKFRNKQCVDTVAETIFPQPLYRDPGIDWCPDLSLEHLHKIDQAARDLYSDYLMMLPVLRTDKANRMGTYFSRMISWPGKETEGINQLDRVISRIRKSRHQAKNTENTLDIDLSADCLNDGVEAVLDGAQLVASDDKRVRGFPCLVHLDFSLLDGELHCAAVYRHHHLLTKAYGNLVGLSNLMQFMCQQSGIKMGELVVLDGLADGQPSSRSRRLAKRLRDELNGATLGLEL
ncbi:MAG: hypothetical protein OXE79_05230 [Acidimicrobiaceae bacterium]|nr:hypothetical protein [Acidimicrobiaceae bacterium]MCY4281068.1 hypothetical protein [Acidimicrobiaceae bacterium]